MTVWTIDVSEHDWARRGGNLDWPSVRSAGIVGMCARATYGDPGGYRFPSYHFGDFVRGAKAAGFTLRGGYHNLVRGDQASINRQVDWLRREMDAHDANWAMLDVERYEELIAAGMVPTWDDVRRFDDRWDAVDQRVLAGYIPPWNWAGYLGRPDLRVFRGPLVPSLYPLGDTSDEYRQLYARCGGDGGDGWVAYGNRVPEGWQYSSRGKVPGAAYICDVNAWRMTSDQLTALLIGDDDMTAEATHNLLSEGWSILTGANAGIIPNEAPGHPPINVGNPLWDMLRAIAAAANVDAAELAAIEAAAKRGAEAGVAAQVDEFVAAVLAGLPDAALTRADVEAALRDVIGSVRLIPGA